MKISARPIATTLLVAIAVGGPWTIAEAQMKSDLHGGWIISDWEAGPGQTGPVPQRGLFIFAETGQYSMMYVIGEPRADLPESPDDGDIAAAYGPFVANSGRYTVSGNELTYEAFVSKDPAYMTRFEPTGGEGNGQTATFSVADGTLTLHFGEGGPMQGATATLARPGGGE